MMENNVKLKYVKKTNLENGVDQKSDEKNKSESNGTKTGASESYQNGVKKDEKSLESTDKGKETKDKDAKNDG